MRIEVYRLIQLCFLYGFSGHFIGCVFYFIGTHQDEHYRFDNTTMMKWTERLAWHKGIIDDVMKLPVWKKYILYLYIGIGIQGASPYGDIIPLTPGEEIFAVIILIWVRILWAWIISEVSSYVGSLYDASARHVSRRDKTVRWMEQNQISDAVV